MAKISLRSNTKFLRLCRDLARPTYQVRGLLEMMWESAYENSVVFKTLDDAEVVSAWDGEIGVFGKAVLNAGFLDEVDGGFQVHDYEDNAPYWWKERERKRKLQEASGKFQEGSGKAPGKRASSVAKRSVEKGKEETNTVPPVGGDGCPFENYERISKAYEKIRASILEHHPKAQLPNIGTSKEFEDRQTLERLIRLDGFTEDDVMATLRWVQREEPQGEFMWRNQFRSISNLRDVKDGMSKFAKINEAMKRSKAKVDAPPKPSLDPKDPLYSELRALGLK